MKRIFFSYSLPTEPSKARVHVWRQLKKLGAVNYQTVWVVPYSTERVNDLKKLTEDIKSYNGGSLLISGNTNSLSKTVLSVSVLSRGAFQAPG
ncbi:MAG: hypothetical protein BWK80_26465 [Desulfobacteraceae bacterium IS3]|nr:MAG: hypothetical protein BWK80_26465 [Desulfobacteraceae bacterium IS3]